MTGIFDWTECAEIAARMDPPAFGSFDAAAAWVRAVMGDQGMQIIDNIAEALWERQRRAREDRG